MRIHKAPYIGHHRRIVDAAKVQAVLASVFGPNELANLQPISTGKFNESYFVSLGSRQYVLRIAPSKQTPVLFYERAMMRREPAVHALVAQRTNAPVATITASDFSGRIIDRDWLIMERLPGRPLSEMPLRGKPSGRLYHQLGAALAQVHQIRNSWYGYPDGSDTGLRAATWYEAFADMWSRLLDDVASTGIYSHAQTDQLAALLEKHAGAFGHNPPAALLHMDVWSQNILGGRDGELLGLVDWDRGLWGDPEIEFSVLEYCGTSPEAFWQGYGCNPMRDREAQIRGLFYLLYEHQKYIYIRSERGRSPNVARRYARESLALARQLE